MWRLKPGVVLLAPLLSIVSVDESLFSYVLAICVAADVKTGERKEPNFRKLLAL